VWEREGDERSCLFLFLLNSLEGIPVSFLLVLLFIVMSDDLFFFPLCSVLSMAMDCTTY
jgi:hypothetical protein